MRMSISYISCGSTRRTSTAWRSFITERSSMLRWRGSPKRCAGPGAQRHSRGCAPCWSRAAARKKQVVTMAANKATFALQSQGRKRALIELVTENGFHIIRACELASAPANVPYVHCFIVRDLFEREREVVVEFAPAARAQLERSS